MSRSKFLTMAVAFCASFAGLAVAPAGHTAMAVIDVKAITQMVKQIHVLESQLTNLQNQLVQAQQQFQSMTGRRAMERLLSGTVRNYLPGDWQELEKMLHGTSAMHAGLAGNLRDVITANAILAPAELSRLAPEVRALIEAERQALALRQVTTRAALENASHRFESVQQLINAIATATDQKAILDLQARIQAEQGMLFNEQTKLQMLYQNAQAEDAARRQKEWEQAASGQGRFATRFQPQP